MNKFLILGVAVLLMIVGGAWWFTNQNGKGAISEDASETCTIKPRKLTFSPGEPILFDWTTNGISFANVAYKESAGGQSEDHVRNLASFSGKADATLNPAGDTGTITLGPVRNEDIATYGPVTYTIGISTSPGSGTSEKIEDLPCYATARVQ
jgi:hypothetical protein